MARLPFITRAPETLKSVNLKIDKALAKPLDWMPTCQDRSYQAFEVEDLGIKQRWIVVFSKAAESRVDTTLNKKLAKEKTKIEKALFHLQAQRFSCQPDAQKELNRVIKWWKLHRKVSHSFREVKKFSAPSRPGKNVAPTAIEYQVLVDFEQDDDAIKHEGQHAQCYVLASHAELVSLTPEEIIEAYSAQQNVERGFRFLKDPYFFTSSLFVKNPRRIEALITVMTLALLVYSYAQRHLRMKLEESGETLPNQIKQPTQSPTLRWVFQIMEGISCITVKTKNGIERIWTGLNEVRLKILKLFSKQVSSIYQISSA